MERNQALEILESINEIYPKFELTDRKISILLPQLEKMDYERVIAKFNAYIVSNPFPPTIADIAAYAPPENETLKKMREWEREAAQVPPEVKKRFQMEMQKLFKDKRHD